MAKNDQTSKLADSAQLIRHFDARGSDELAFMARMLVQATLPHSDPGKVAEFSRVNGSYRLSIQPGVGVGVPYGSYPRLVLAWLTTEAVQKKSRRLVLGDSLSSFMGELGLMPTGGRWGTITRLREQMKRLFSARIAAIYDDQDAFQMRSMEVATDVDLWWSPKHPDQATIFESVVVLGERFYRAILERPVPIDMRVLKALKRSPLGLDLYTWLTYRVSYLDAPTAISWDDLHEQFGADYNDTKNFARKCKRELTKIALVWPELKYKTPRGRLVLSPTPPHVAKLGPKLEQQNASRS